MMELIKITETNGKQVISARELHEFLGSKKDFSNWIKHRIEKYDLIENHDYAVFAQKGENLSGGGRPSIEYALTIDAAKELSMVEGNEKGKQARKYFIEIEKSIHNPLSQFDFMQMSLDVMRKQSERIDGIETKLNEIKAINAPIEHFSILGYCHNIGKKVSLNEAISLGRKAAKICKELGLSVGKISDGRYGTVNTYPIDVLKEVTIL